MYLLFILLLTSDRVSLCFEYVASAHSVHATVRLLQCIYNCPIKGNESRMITFSRNHAIAIMTLHTDGLKLDRFRYIGCIYLVLKIFKQYYKQLLLHIIVLLLHLILKCSHG